MFGGMNTRWSILLTILMQGIAMCCCLAGGSSSLTGIKTHFIPEAVLTTNELKTVIKFANQCGVLNVEEVSTSYMVPSSAIVIRVKSVDSICKREVRSVAVYIGCEKWTGTRPKSEA